MKKILLEWEYRDFDEKVLARALSDYRAGRELPNADELAPVRRGAIEVGFTEAAEKAIARYPILERLSKTWNICDASPGEQFAWPCTAESAARFLLFDIRSKVRWGQYNPGERWFSLVLDGGIAI